jgi:hypothetical protein
LAGVEILSAYSSLSYQSTRVFETRKMTVSIESTSPCNSRLLSNRGRYARPAAPWKLSAHTAALLARLRDVAPYAAIELILPGGSLIALALWLYRRHKKEPG